MGVEGGSSMINKVEVNTDTRGLHPNSHLESCDGVSGSPICKQPVKVVWVRSDSLSRGRFRIQFSRVKRDFYMHEWDTDISLHGYHFRIWLSHHSRRKEAWDIPWGAAKQVWTSSINLSLSLSGIYNSKECPNGARSAEGDHSALTIPRKSGEFKT